MHMEPVAWYTSMKVMDIPVFRFPLVPPLTGRAMLSIMFAIMLGGAIYILGDGGNQIVIPLLLGAALFYGYVRGKTFEPYERLINWIRFVIVTQQRQRRAKAAATEAKPKD